MYISENSGALCADMSEFSQTLRQEIGREYTIIIGRDYNINMKWL